MSFEFRPRPRSPSPRRDRTTEPVVLPRRAFLFLRQMPFSARMAKFVETVMIKDGGRERAVKVTIDTPNPEELDIQYLAQRAWLQPGKKLKIGNLTLSVKAFGRR